MASSSSHHDQLYKLHGEGKYAEMAALLDTVSMDLGGIPPNNWPYSLHLLGHLAANNLDDARFLYKRIPDEVKQRDQELGAVWNIAQHLWVRDYPGIQKALRAPWTAEVAPVVAYIAQQHQTRMLELLSRAYTTISPDDTAACLGLQRDQAIQLVTQLGWELDAASGLLKPRPPPPAARGMPTVDHLHRMVEYAVHLG